MEVIESNNYSDPPASACWILGLLVWATMSGYSLICLLSVSSIQCILLLNIAHPGKFWIVGKENCLVSALLVVFKLIRRNPCNNWLLEGKQKELPSVKPSWKLMLVSGNKVKHYSLELGLIVLYYFNKYLR